VKTIASILVLIGPVFGGCLGASSYWYNPAKTVNEAERDCRQCYDQAVRRASEDFADEYYGRSSDMRESPHYSGRYDHLSSSEFGALREWTLWGTTYRENLFRGCMKSKGYRLTRKDDLAPRVRIRWLAAGKIAGR
jgi:hypothetical protein